LNKAKQLSRLEQIAHLLEVELADLFNLDKTAIFKLSIHHSQTSNDNQSVNFSGLTQNIEHELEKNRLLLAQKDKEIEYLKQQVCDLREMIALLKK